jgi:2'-5' RNA ligase
VGVFGPVYAPRVLWVGVGGATDRLRAAQRGCVVELDARGLPHDDKPFAAHLTLARRQRALSPDEQTRLQAIMAEPAPPNVAWQADEIAVMASELHPSGARYRRLAGYRFVAAGGESGERNNGAS